MRRGLCLLTVAMAALVLLLVAPLAGRVYLARAVASGRFDLCVDLRDEVLILPRSRASTGRPPIPLSDITSVDVADSDDGQLSWSVQMTTREGELIEIEAAHERATAEALRDWLREQIGLAVSRN